MKVEPFRPNISKINQSSNNKSLVDRQNQQILQISHQEVNFLNTQINQLYEISINIRNVTKNSIKIKIRKPSSPFLAVHLGRQTLLAPGLDLKVTIVLDNKENITIKDKIIIMSDGLQLQVPVNVYPQVLKLQFEPFLNFGFHKIGSTIEFPWKLVNQSQFPTQIKLIPLLMEQNASLNLSSEEFRLQSHQTKIVTISLSSKINGTIEGSVQIQPKTLGYSTLEFVANFCDYNRMICDKQGKQLKQMIIQPMFGGQTKKIDFFMVNNTPESCEYRITRKKGANGEQNNNLVTPQQIGRDDIEKLVQFSPSQGDLLSYTTATITTMVSAKLQDNDIQLFCNYILGKYEQENFQKQWNYNIRSYINHQEQFFDMQIKGTSLIPKIGLNPSHLSFNDCYLQQKIKKSIQIENFSSKSVTIQLENSANFLFTPSKIKLQPNTSNTVQVCFNPKKIGQLNQICHLSVGSFAFPIKLFGKCLFGSNRHQTDNSGCEQLLLQNLEKSCLEDQISSIYKGKNHQLICNTEHSSSKVHFDTNIQGYSKGDNSICNQNVKRTKMLRSKNGKQVKIDLNHLNPNQIIQIYSSIPKNQQQQRIIARQLSSDELKNISVGPVVIDIGTIFLRSTKRKTFNICNFNNKPISIKLQSHHQSFTQTSDERQILPAQSHGGFYINYQALIQGTFKHNLQYVLNGNHFFQVMVTGVCIAPIINFSRNQVKFNITQQDKKFQKTQIIKLENHYQYDTEFQWKLPANSQFVVQPTNGIVKGNNQIPCSIILNYQFLTEGKIQQVLKLKLKHGKTIDLKCSGIVPESNCLCKNTQIKFDDICIGRQYQQKVQIKNLSKVNTIFKLSIPKEYENIIMPSFKNNSLLAQDITEISFKILSTKICTIDTKIQVIIRGSKTITLNLKANVILPLIRVENQQIDFGPTPIQGNFSQKEVFLVNDSLIPAEIQLRFYHDTFLYKLLKLKDIVDPNINVVETKQLKMYKVICMKINPKSKCSFTLQFSPQTTQQYQFYLPLFLPNVEPIEDIQKICRCKGIKNRLTVSQKQINFGKIVIDQIEHFYGKNYVIQIFNPQQEAISWWIEQSNLSPFKIDKCKGKLQGFQKFNIKVYFSAQCPGQYKRDLQFFIDQAQMDISKCYMKIPIIACACYPVLYFDRPYVILPTIRSGLQSRTTLEIINGGYQNINLKHTVVQQQSGVDININYPVGSNLGVTKKQIKVQIIAKSDKPVSFTFKINFHDNNNRTFSINVSGTFDNHTFTLIQHQKTPNLIEKSCLFLKNYLNNTGYLSEEIYEFPQSLIQNQFQKLSQFLASYSPIFQKIKLTIKKNFKSFINIEYIAQLIKLLKAEGAFLNHIRPQMLLSYDEYLSNLLKRADNNQVKYSYFDKKDKNSYYIQQKYCWIVLFYQIFKVFSKVNPGKLKQNAQFWLKFIMRQKILLNWIEKSYQSQTGLQPQIKGNLILSKFNNGQMLSALISKYTNIKVLQGYGKIAKGIKQKQRRCKQIIDILSQIGINNLLKLQDLQRSSQKQMLLVLQNLYTILPSYLQKGDPIIFNCQFGQVVTKSVQVTNPSKMPINYVAKIQGSKAYSIDGQSQFVIQSKKTQQIKIKYISNVNINNIPATLTLTGKPNNKFTPSTFIFLLKSNILGRISQKSIHVTANIYQQLDFTIKVPNSLNSDAQFKIQLHQGPKNNYQSFYVLNNTLKIKKGQTGILNMVFLPMIMQTQSAVVIFKDQKVGEFQYDLTGMVEPNVLCQQSLRIPSNIYTNKKYLIQLQIPQRNDLILRGRKAAQFLADKLEKKNLTAKDFKQIINYQKYYPKLSNSQVYSVKLSHPNNSISIKTQQIVLKDIESTDQSKRQQQKVTIQINMKTPIKQGSFSINLRNINGSDIRKYKVFLTAIAKPLRYQLQLKIPVNKTIVQPLPLINITNQRNIYHISLVPNNQLSKNVFNLDRERQIIIQPKEQSSINLNFKPRTQSIFHAFLKMENVTTGQNIQYNLVGIGQQPEAQTLLFQQQVRKQKLYNIKLPFSKNTKCNVISFNLQGAQYQKIFSTTSENQNFKFKFYPKLSGKYQAKLLIDGQHTVTAYLVNINVKNIIQGQIKLRTFERKQASTSIVLPQGNYQTRYDDHNLKVPLNAIINQQNPSLNISYYSSIPQEKQIEVTFLNQKLGQITYIIKIIVEPIPQIKFQPFIVELGKIHKQKICFQNTDDCSIQIRANSTNSSIFYSEFESIEVPAKSKVESHILYKASSLQLEEGKIFFTSNKNAKWTYHLSGYGLPQTKSIKKQFYVNVGEQVCQSIIFRNPLNKTLPFLITLENYDQQAPFSALIKNYKLDLDYNQELEIPITLTPKKVNLYQALLKIIVNDKICWKYDLIAQVGYKSNEQVKSFKLIARCRNEQLLQYCLPYSQQYNGEKVKLSIKGVNQNILKVDNGGQSIIKNSKVAFNLNILSNRPKNIQTTMQISKQNGCKWIYKCQFIILPPPIDDKFQIISVINKPSSVKFRLTNNIKSYAKFNAYFTSDSCIDFTLTPKSGELEPYGREGTVIQVIFCPTQYKKNWFGRLIIQSQDNYWSYQVKGSLPHYNPPVGKSHLNQQKK